MLLVVSFLSSLLFFSHALFFDDIAVTPFSPFPLLSPSAGSNRSRWASFPFSFFSPFPSLFPNTTVFFLLHFCSSKRKRDEVLLGLFFFSFLCSSQRLILSPFPFSLDPIHVERVGGGIFSFFSFPRRRAIADPLFFFPFFLSRHTAARERSALFFLPPPFSVCFFRPDDLAPPFFFPYWRKILAGGRPSPLSLRTFFLPFLPCFEEKVIYLLLPLFFLSFTFQYESRDPFPFLVGRCQLGLFLLSCQSFTKSKPGPPFWREKRPFSLPPLRGVHLLSRHAFFFSFFFPPTTKNSPLPLSLFPVSPLTAILSLFLLCVESEGTVEVRLFFFLTMDVFRKRSFC